MNRGNFYTCNINNEILKLKTGPRYLLFAKEEETFRLILEYKKPTCDIVYLISCKRLTIKSQEKKFKQWQP